MTDSEQKKIFSENLKYYVEKSGKEQKQISIDLDVKPSTFNTWIRGKNLPSVSMIKSLAAYLHCGLHDLVDERSEDTISPEKQLLNYYHAINVEGKTLLINHARLLFNSGEYREG